MNRFCTGQGLCAAALHKWKYSVIDNCPYGQVQTMNHFAESCLLMMLADNSLQMIHSVDNKRWFGWIPLRQTTVANDKCHGTVLEETLSQSFNHLMHEAVHIWSVTICLFYHTSIHCMFHLNRGNMYTSTQNMAWHLMHSRICSLKKNKLKQQFKPIKCN